MARCPDLKLSSAAEVPPLRHCFYRQRRFREMNSRRAHGKRHVQPIIDQNARAGSLRVRYSVARQLGEGAAFKILFTNLNPVDSRARCGADSFANRLAEGIQWGIRTTAGRIMRTLERAPVGHIAEDWLTSGWQRSPRVPAAFFRRAEYPAHLTRLPRRVRKDAAE